MACLPELETTARTIIAGAQQIRTDTIDRIMEMDDAALGLAWLPDKGFPSDSVADPGCDHRGGPGLSDQEVSVPAHTL